MIFSFARHVKSKSVKQYIVHVINPAVREREDASKKQTANVQTVNPVNM